MSRPAPLAALSLPVTVAVQSKLHLGVQLGDALCRGALWEALCGGAHVARSAAIHDGGVRRVVPLDAPGAPLLRAGWRLHRVLDQPRHQAPVPPETAQLVLRRVQSAAAPGPDVDDLARRLSRSAHLLHPQDAAALRVVLEDDGHRRALRVRRRRPGGGVLLHDLLHGDGLPAWMGLSPSLASWMLPGTGGLPPGTVFGPVAEGWDSQRWTLRAPRAVLPGILGHQAHLVVRRRSAGPTVSADLCLPLDPRDRDGGLATVAAVRGRLEQAGLLRPGPVAGMRAA